MNEGRPEDIYGIFASQLGQDATTAADQDLSLSSSFPMLKIGYEATKTFTVTGSGGPDIVLAEHNLGYPCFYMVTIIESNAVFNQPLETIVSSTQIILTLPAVGTYTTRVTAFRNRLSDALVTPVFLTQSKTAAQRNRDYGLWVSKEGKSAESTDLRDFTFHSGTRNLLIHQVVAGIVNPTNQRLSYINNLPYRPIYYVFASTDNGVTYRLLPGGNQSFPGMFQDVNGDVHLLGGVDSTMGSVWVFKDPMNPGASKNVII